MELSNGQAAPFGMLRALRPSNGQGNMGFGCIEMLANPCNVASLLLSPHPLGQSDVIFLRRYTISTSFKLSSGVRLAKNPITSAKRVSLNEDAFISWDYLRTRFSFQNTLTPFQSFPRNSNSVTKLDENCCSKSRLVPHSLHRKIYYNALEILRCQDFDSAIFLR